MALWYSVVYLNHGPLSFKFVSSDHFCNFFSQDLLDTWSPMTSIGKLPTLPMTLTFPVRKPEDLLTYFVKIFLISIDFIYNFLLCNLFFSFVAYCRGKPS